MVPGKKISHLCKAGDVYEAPILWGRELEYFTHWFVASARDSNHLTNHPEALPLSHTFPLHSYS